MRQQSDNKNVKPVKNKSTSFKVTEKMELMQFLNEKFKGKSRTGIKSLLSNKQVIVDGKAITQFNYNLIPGQEVTINNTKPAKEIKLKGLTIIYEDEYLIVIRKEAGLLSIATENPGDITAYNLLSEYVKDENPKNQIYVLHRLDRETSGLMMFAKDYDVKRELQSDWQESVMERCYIALVEGRVETPKDTITSWLVENKNYLVFSSQNPNLGQKAVTHYKLLKAGNKYSLLEIKLETGRKNQIRVHMQDIGHSVVGDKKYGAKQNPLNRLGLHAYILAFRHPKTGEILKFETKIPNEFLKIFND